MGLIIIIMGVAAAVLLIARHPDRRLRKILILALVLRLGLLLIHKYIVPLPDSGADAVMFEQMGWRAAQAWRNGETVTGMYGGYSYGLIVGLFYFIFGRIDLIPSFVNVILGILIVFYLYKVAFLLTGDVYHAQLASLFGAVFPTLNLYSAIILRENLIILMMVLSVYCFVNWLDQGGLFLVIKTLGTLIVAGTLNGAMILVGAVYAVYFCFYSPQKKGWNVSWRQLLASAALLGVGFVFFNRFLLDKLPLNLSLFSVELLKASASGAARDRAAYLINYLPESYLDLIIQTPVRMVYFLYMPFPWKAAQLKDMLGILDSALFMFLTAFSFSGIKQLSKRNRAACLALILIFVVLLSAFSWGTSNYGTAIRHRLKIVWVLILFASLRISLGTKFQWFFRKENQDEKNCKKAV